MFCGDIEIDRGARVVSEAASRHNATHKDIPLTHAKLRRDRDVTAPLAFDTALAPFEYAPKFSSAVAMAVLDEALARPPGVNRIVL